MKKLYFIDTTRIEAKKQTLNELISLLQHLSTEAYNTLPTIEILTKNDYILLIQSPELFVKNELMKNIDNIEVNSKLGLQIAKEKIYEMVSKPDLSNLTKIAKDISYRYHEQHFLSCLDLLTPDCKSVDNEKFETFCINSNYYKYTDNEANYNEFVKCIELMNQFKDILFNSNTFNSNNLYFDDDHNIIANYKSINL